MKDWGVIFQNRPDACIIKAEDITSRDLSTLEQGQKIQALICLLNYIGDMADPLKGVTSGDT